MIRAALLTLLLLPLAAQADPITITVALIEAGVASGVAAGVASVAAFVAANALTIGFIGMSVYGSASARRKSRGAAARARAAANARLEDRSVTLLQANPPWRVIYGRCIVGGDIVAIFTSNKSGYRDDGSNYSKPDALKHLVIVLAAHECEAINEIYIEGVPLGTLDGNGLVTGGAFYSAGAPDTRTISIGAGGNATVPEAVVAVLSCFYSTGISPDVIYHDVVPTLSVGNTVITNPSAFDVVVNYTIAHSSASRAAVRVGKHLGTDTQTVDTYLNSVAVAEWTANHRLRGLCYVVVTLDLEEPRFQGGPPAMTFDVSGRKVLDTRTSTTAYSTNPALIVRDWLVSPWGYGVDSADIDTTACNAAANACDVAVLLTVGIVSSIGTTYTCNGAFTTADAREAVLGDLCESMAGFAAYGATWSISAGAWSSPVMTLTDDDLDGQIGIVQAGAGMDALFNGIRGSYIPAGKSTPTDFDTYQNATFVAADGVELWQDLTLPFTDHKARARNLARIFTERNRDGLMISYPAKLKAWPLQINDRVAVTSAEYGFSAKTFRVTDWQFGTGTAVNLTLQEDAAVIYDLADAATADPSPNTALPDPWSVAAITGLSAVSNSDTLITSVGAGLVPRVLVTWTAVSDAYVADGSGRIEILWKRPGGPWRLISEPGDAISTYIVGAAHGDRILIEARARNGLGKAGPSAFLGHTVVGAFSSPDIVLALANAAAAQATADGKIGSFYQATAPGSASEGDIWFDTDDGYRQYRWTSGAWVVAADTRIGDAINNAATAQATADGKIVSFITASTPTATAVGDLWWDSDDGYKLYRATAPGAGSWVAYQLDTAALAAGAATSIYQDSYDFGGATYGTTTARSFTVTPANDCTVEFSATVNAAQILGDSGSTLGWYCDAGGGGDTLLGGSATNNTARQDFSALTAFAATGGVMLTFKLKTNNAGGSNPVIPLYKSSMRVTQVKR